MESRPLVTNIRNRHQTTFSAIIALIGLYLVSLHNYLLFHSLAELFRIIIAGGIFIIAWNTRRLLNNHYLLFLGVAYFFIGMIDLIHTLAYKGMGVFPADTANLPTQLWIGARYLESISLLIAPWFLTRKLWPGLVFCLYFFIVAAILSAIFSFGIFPDCFLEGKGLTPFKKFSEYIISTTLLLALFVLLKNRQHFDAAVLRLLSLSILLAVGGELAFTFYVSVFDLSNLVGHLFKIVSFGLIYVALVKTGLTKPFDLLFRDLKQKEAKLERARAELESRVLERTEELRQLTCELGERVKELNCLYEISKIIEQKITPELSIPAIAKIITGSVRYPEIAGARIIFNGREFKTSNFVENDGRVSNDIMVNGEIAGAVEVAYLDKMPDREGALFLKEERNLIAAVANRLGLFFERVETEKKNHELENQLRQAQKMDAIGTLAGGIAHDFNNILGIILGYTNLIKEDAPPDTKFLTDLDQVLKAGYRAQNLVKQILSFSRQSKVERILLSPQPLIKESLKMLRASIPTTIEIQQEISSRCGTIMADPTHFHQILMNLCTNAFQAMETDGGVLKVALRMAEDIPPDLRETAEKTGEEVYLDLSVSDSGPGIDPDIINNIFDPFFTTKEPGKGTGMGLAIVYGIVKDYGGTVTVDSKLGEGTTFHVFLPQIQGQVSQEPVEEERPLTGNERILLVDDEEILAIMNKKILERLGYQVTAVKDSLEALALFEKQPDIFDLVITDQTMPGITGLELAGRILLVRPGIPIILCTGYSSTVTEDIARAKGIKAFVLKPLVKGAISKLIRQILDK